jgi:hypothetical protein
VGALNEVLTQLQTAAVSTGLAINTDKTKYVKTKKTVRVANIDMLWTKLWKANTFKYLGSVTASQNEIEYDMKDRIAAANWRFQTLNKIYIYRN